MTEHDHPDGERDGSGRPRPGPGGWWPVPDRSVLPTVLGDAGVGSPLVNAFPTMALTTGLALTAGLFRMLTQRLRTAKRPVSPRRGSAADAAP